MSLWISIYFSILTIDPISFSFICYFVFANYFFIYFFIHFILSYIKIIKLKLLLELSFTYILIIKFSVENIHFIKLIDNNEKLVTIK